MIFRLILGAAFVCLFMNLAVTAFGQQGETKAYVSIGLGPTVKLNGGQYPFALTPYLELGFEIANGFGLVGSLTGGNFYFDEQYYYFNGTQWTQVPVDTQINYGLWGVGPMYSARINLRSSVDFKARIGRYKYKDWSKGRSVHLTNENASMGYYISATYQYRWLPRWTLFSSIDYATNRPDFKFESYGSMSTIGVSVGLGFRF